MNQRKLISLYIVSDIFASALAWCVFFFFRKLVIERRLFGDELHITPDNRFMLGVFLIPLFWLAAYYIAGYYKGPLRKSRLTDLGTTFLITLFGTIVLFFGLILDDFVGNYTNYYLSFSVLFGLQFLFSYIPRYIVTSRTVKLIHKEKIGFNTLIIGANGRATDIYKKIVNQRISTGNKFVGFISVTESDKYQLAEYLPDLGTIDILNTVITDHGIEEVIIAIEPDETSTLGRIINKLNNNNTIIKAIPGMYDILLGRVKMSAIFGTPLILLNPELVPVWQRNIKQVLDFAGSLIALVLSLPISVFLAVSIRLSGKGPVIFTQERIGLKGKPFKLYKFRSMSSDAEKDGPALSGENDPRVTRIGRFMRRHRLDEIPNFINVLKSEMSLVGPRPEREFYINQIVDRAPQYNHLLKIKPGITSWGQVKYGYASNIDEMIERLEYDLIYLENMSLYIDLKITIYTLITVMRGSGV
ncbi:MAG TPA: sugar transferase [Bacteroidales bacterium]|nr:sugar transferase [Bacteroidales bacterium]